MNEIKKSVMKHIDDVSRRVVRVELAIANIPELVNVFSEKVENKSIALKETSKPVFDSLVAGAERIRQCTHTLTATLTATVYPHSLSLRIQSYHNQGPSWKN